MFTGGSSVVMFLCPSVSPGFELSPLIRLVQSSKTSNNKGRTFLEHGNQGKKELIPGQINLHFALLGININMTLVVFSVKYSQGKKKDSPTISELCHLNKEPIQTAAKAICSLAFLSGLYNNSSISPKSRGPVWNTQAHSHSSLLKSAA